VALGPATFRPKRRLANSPSAQPLYAYHRVGGGGLGAAVTFGLTYVREHRRSLDGYRTPQSHAVGEIVIMAHAAPICELESSTALTEWPNGGLNARACSTHSIEWPSNKLWGRAVLRVCSDRVGDSSIAIKHSYIHAPVFISGSEFQ
jgi:hypothetical protein